VDAAIEAPAGIERVGLGDAICLRENLLRSREPEDASGDTRDCQ
jgi:hypothetical protein